GGEIPQLLNLLFGNVSMQAGVVVADVDWPLELLASLGGPRHGIAGLRELTGARGGPLLCTALKPLGVSAAQLAERAYRFALPAGLDAVRAVAATGLATMAHPSLAGAFFHEDHGIAPPVLLGDLFRLAGSDAVIYPNVEGRFTLSEATCAAINARLRAPLGS